MPFRAQGGSASRSSSMMPCPRRPPCLPNPRDFKGGETCGGDVRRRRRRLWSVKDRPTGTDAPSGSPAGRMGRWLLARRRSGRRAALHAHCKVDESDPVSPYAVRPLLRAASVCVCVCVCGEQKEKSTRALLCAARCGTLSRRVPALRAAVQRLPPAPP
ncbi:hypothetical protein BDY21DRAFT_163476 [Lineolata rhizophorae]|uniref:Uncharacterized protein n=1 Tax=Lineolata rhizophorae TaxID=578093 RepID=A0A6A6P8Q1_9PEZI|nr:hypothetical protein BDY21DRAFT_163476 [Lineolata rhizophorae]